MSRCPDVPSHFSGNLIGYDASFWQWFWRRLYCLYRLVSALADDEINVQSLSVRTVHVYTLIPPRCPRAVGGEETLLSVAGLGAYICTI